MEEAYGKINIIPEVTRVVDMVVGRTAEAYKILPGFGVQVWVKERGMELENWPWKMVTVRQPRYVKRYPRPFRFPREEPTKQCHCKIGLMEVISVEEAQVRCTRCKFLVGSESYPRRIERATKMLEDAAPYREVPLTRGQVALVSKEDYKRVMRHKWYAAKYAVRNNPKDRRKVFMHKFILRTESEVDHINENKLDNTRSNLRECTHSQNKMNVGITRANQSGYKGVSVSKSGRRWVAQIQVKGKVIWLGRYRSKERAARMYDKAAIKYHGRFAKTNFPIRKDNPRQSGLSFYKGVSRRRKRTTSRRNKISVKARKRSKGSVVVRPKRSSNATKSTKTRKRASLPAKRRRPRKISARSHPALPKIQRQVGQKAGVK